MRERSLLLITIDCLRADHVGFCGYDRGTTPFLDSVAATSFVVPRAIAAGAPTYFAFPAIMASRYPLALGRDVPGIAPGEATLATALQSAGYATAAFVAGNPYLAQRFGYDQGFATFRDSLTTAAPGDADPPEQGNFRRWNQTLRKASSRRKSTAAAYEELYFRYCQWKLGRSEPSLDRLRRYPAADVIVDQARAWLSRVRQQPFFLWLHLMDPHHPYFPPEQALSEIGRGDMSCRRAAFVNALWSRDRVNRKRLFAVRNDIVSLYDAGVYWADKQISRLVAALKHFHQWDDTVLAVTADHGEELLESEERYHRPTSLSERLIHVPLLVRVPNEAGVRQSDAPFSLIHLAPTLLEALQVGVPPNFRGKSLWTEIKAGRLDTSPAVVECVYGCQNAFSHGNRLRSRLLAVRNSRYKLVINFQQQAETMFDLEADPLESRPLGERVCKSERVQLLQVALQHLSSAQNDSELRLRARMREIQQLTGPIHQQEHELVEANA